MRVFIMVGGSRFFCLAPCLYVCNSFNLVVVVVLATPTGPSELQVLTSHQVRCEVQIRFWWAG